MIEAKCRLPVCRAPVSTKIRPIFDLCFFWIFSVIVRAFIIWRIIWNGKGKYTPLFVLSH